LYREYQRLTARYRDAKTKQELDSIFREEGANLKTLLQNEKSLGLTALEHYMYFYKKLSFETHGNGKFKGRDKKGFIARVLEKI